MRIFCVLPVVLLVGVQLVYAQSEQGADSPVKDRSFKLLSEGEDWSFLRDPTLCQDFWDPIKYIRLREGSDDWYLTIGGEAREVWEQIGNDNWGQQPFMNGYFNERYMVHFDVHYGKHVRTFVELKSGLNSYRIGGPRPIDEKKLDFQAGFLEVGTSEGANSFAIRVGRQELEYGSGRLLDVREGPNVRLSFDGFMVKSKIDSWQIDGFAVRPDLDKPGYFDNAPNHAVGFWGVYATRSLPRKVSLDVYSWASTASRRLSSEARLWRSGTPWARGFRAPSRPNSLDWILTTKAFGSSARSVQGTSGHGPWRPKRAIDFRQFG